MWYMLQRPKAVPASGCCRRRCASGVTDRVRAQALALLAIDQFEHRTCMSETKETTDKTLRGGGSKPLSLKRTVESGHVRQSFSHGRSKSVVVEKKKTRKLTTPGEADESKVLETAEVGRGIVNEVVQPKTGG